MKILLFCLIIALLLTIVLAQDDQQQVTDQDIKQLDTELQSTQERVNQLEKESGASLLLANIVCLFGLIAGELFF